MNWSQDKLEITQKYFEVINLNNLELIAILRDNLEEINPVYPLIEFVISRLETVTTLVIDDRIWDAEIILRSALETFVKFIFITSADKDEQKKRIEEYWISLAEINKLKLSEQGKKNLKHFGASEMHRLAYLPLVLSEEEENELRKKWTRIERQKVEQKWSFTEMIILISKAYQGKPLEMLITLTYSYRMSSHVMHGDETGIQIIQERESRSQEEYEKAHAGHYLRLLSDCSVYCAFLGLETAKFLNLKEKRHFFFKNREKLDSVQKLVEKYQGRVFDDKDYDKYRTPDKTGSNSDLTK